MGATVSMAVILLGPRILLLFKIKKNLISISQLKILYCFLPVAMALEGDVGDGLHGDDPPWSTDPPIM